MRWLVLAVALVVMAGAPAAPGARESYSVARGDTITLRYSIRTDSVLKVAGTQIVAAKCGYGVIYLRTLKKGVVQSADTILVQVQCPGAPTPASVSLCLANPDSVKKYAFRGDTSGDPRLLGCTPVGP